MNRGKYPNLSYRPDIDGLRALAVLLVVADHIGTRARGGYVGVDVFFVISGYLISSHILTEMQAGTFSIVDFYERRIRRILPVLIAVLIAVTLVAYLFLIPSEIEAYARSLLAALFSVSNFEFWRESGYFDDPSKFKPLLHTWSLGVEEQFYIFFPLMLLAVRRWLPTRLKLVLWATFGLSLAASIAWAPRSPAAAFFFTPLRIWELLVGTVLSQHYVPSLQGKVQRNLASLLGFLLIVAPAFVYTQYTVFPGLTAVPPCLGAALIIAAGETGGSLVGSILSWRPVVFIGLISYSLYLWHWPILAFQDTTPLFVRISTHSGKSKFLYMVVVLILATLSWRFIETPFRKGRFRPSRRSLFAMAGASFVLVAAMGIQLLAMHGIPAGYPQDALKLLPYTDYHYSSEWRSGKCFFIPEQDFANFDSHACLPQTPGRPQYLVIGDSHAAHLYPGLVAAFPDADIQQINSGFCPPLVTEGKLLPGFKKNCLMMSKFVYQDYLPRHHVDLVILSCVWSSDQLPELGHTLAWIKDHGMKAVVVGPGLEYSLALPRLLMTSIRRHDRDLVPSHLAIHAELDNEMRQLAQEQWKTEYVSVYSDLCLQRPDTVAKSAVDMRSCPAYAAPNVPMLFDGNHLTAEGSILLVKTMKANRQIP
jgi:peptidoglycan/LPS O-acetylase OafA/YrhL